MEMTTQNKQEPNLYNNGFKSGFKLGKQKALKEVEKMIEEDIGWYSDWVKEEKDFEIKGQLQALLKHSNELKQKLKEMKAK